MKKKLGSIIAGCCLAAAGIFVPAVTPQASAWNASCEPLWDTIHGHGDPNVAWAIHRCGLYGYIWYQDLPL